MKIVFFTDTYDPQTNGVVSYIKDTINELKKSNEVVLFAPSKEKKLRLEEIDQNFKIYWVPSSSFPLYEGYLIASADYKRISNFLTKEKPDIIHAHIPVWLGLQGIIAGKRRKIPIVITYHTHLLGYTPNLLKFKENGLLNKLTQSTVKRMIKYTYGMADVVIAPTKELLEELRKYGLKNVKYVPNGVDFSKLNSDKKTVEMIRKRYGIENKQVVLYLGRLSVEKRLENLIDAFGAVSKPERVLIIAGNGPSKKSLIEYVKAKKLQNVIFTGHIDQNEIGSIYCTADVFASASDSETFGLTFVEAMHFGIPVIGANRLGVREVVEDGSSGLLVKALDTKGFAEAIDKLLRSTTLWQKMSNGAKERSTHYSIEVGVSQLMEIYKSLLKNNQKTTK
jgi:glycosyltransferase involved in cell wall biosynthesis